MSSHYYEPVVGSPGTLPRRVPTSVSNGYYTLVFILLSSGFSSFV